LLITPPFSFFLAPVLNPPDHAFPLRGTVFLKTPPLHFVPFPAHGRPLPGDVVLCFLSPNTGSGTHLPLFALTKIPFPGIFFTGGCTVSFSPQCLMVFCSLFPLVNALALVFPRLFNTFSFGIQLKLPPAQMYRLPFRPLFLNFVTPYLPPRH